MTRRSDGFRKSPSPRRAMIQIAIALAVLIGMSVMLHQAPAQGPTTPDPVTSNANEVSPAKPVPKRGIPRNPIEVWVALGPFRYPLALTSIIVVWFSIERLVVLRRGRVIPRPFVRRFFEHLEEGKLDSRSALKLCEESGSPIASIFAHGIRKWGKSSVEVEQAIIDGGDRQVSQLRKHLRALNGASTVAPLLGLLGTVVGMIDSFDQIATKSGMGKSEELAGGIGLALLTTASGLIIAIPAMTMYMYFTGRVDALVIEMDGHSQKLVDLISAEGLAEQARNPRTAPMTKPESRKAAV